VHADQGPAPTAYHLKGQTDHEGINVAAQSFGRT